MLKIYCIKDEVSCTKLFSSLILNKVYLVGLDCEFTQYKLSEGYSNFCSILQICTTVDLFNDGGIVFSDLIVPIEYTANFFSYIIYIEKIYKEHKGVPKELSHFLRSKDIVKVGCDITSDSKVIKSSYNIELQNIIDNQCIAQTLGIEGISMSKLSKRLFGIDKLKFDVVNLSGTTGQDRDWSNCEDVSMIKYCAYDAFLSLILYYKLINYGGIIKRKVPIKSETLVGENTYSEGNALSKSDILEAFNILNILKKTNIFTSKIQPTTEKVITTLNNCHKSFTENLNRIQIKDKLNKYLVYLNKEQFIIYDGNTVKLNV